MTQNCLHMTPQPHFGLDGTALPTMLFRRDGAIYGYEVRGYWPGDRLLVAATGSVARAAFHVVAHDEVYRDLRGRLMLLLLDELGGLDPDEAKTLTRTRAKARHAAIIHARTIAQVADDIFALCHKHKLLVDATAA